MLSIVVNFFNNRREAANTLYSLGRSYQQGIGDVPYEVIVIDHGSTSRLDESMVRSFGPEFRYRFVDTTAVSPVKAINDGCREAAGDRLLVMIDGAHIASPGILRHSLDAFTLFPAPFIATVPFHLGPGRQNVTIAQGYNAAVEEEYLAKSGWRSNGYRLYTIAGNFADGSDGWFGCLFETGCFGMRKRDYLDLGGFDERFQARGGGLVNLDLFDCALARADFQYVLLVGEATFHQVHGGVASNAPASAHPWAEFHQDYVAIRGKPYQRRPRPPYYLGTLPAEAMPIAQESLRRGTAFWTAQAGK